MTEQDKDILIGKMIDSPSSLTDEELDMIQIDDELKDIYKISSELMGASMPQPEMDVEREWRLFRHRILPKPSPTRWIMRVAAIFLGVIFIGGVLVRIIDKALDVPKTTVAIVQETKKTVEIKPNEENTNSKAIRKKEESQSLISSSKDASSGQHMSMSKNMKEKQMDLPEEEIDVDEYLRLQQARIDNDLAMMAAESYIYEYNEFLQEIDDPNAYETTELENAIRQVTMQ